MILEIEKLNDSIILRYHHRENINFRIGFYKVRKDLEKAIKKYNIKKDSFDYELSYVYASNNTTVYDFVPRDL